MCAVQDHKQKLVRAQSLRKTSSLESTCKTHRKTIYANDDVIVVARTSRPIVRQRTSNSFWFNTRASVPWITSMHQDHQCAKVVEQAVTCGLTIRHVPCLTSTSDTYVHMCRGPRDVCWHKLNTLMSINSCMQHFQRCSCLWASNATR